MEASTPFFFSSFLFRWFGLRFHWVGLSFAPLLRLVGLSFAPLLRRVGLSFPPLLLLAYRLLFPHFLVPWGFRRHLAHRRRILSQGIDHR